MKIGLGSLLCSFEISMGDSSAVEHVPAPEIDL